MTTLEAVQLMIELYDHTLPGGIQLTLKDAMLLASKQSKVPLYHLENYLLGVAIEALRLNPLTDQLATFLHAFIEGTLADFTPDFVQDAVMKESFVDLVSALGAWEEERYRPQKQVRREAGTQKTPLLTPPRTPPDL